jgi:hypothetical protein
MKCYDKSRVVGEGGNLSFLSMSHEDSSLCDFSFPYICGSNMSHLTQNLYWCIMAIQEQDQLYGGKLFPLKY